jgi:hypothetical protein
MLKVLYGAILVKALPNNITNAVHYRYCGCCKNEAYLERAISVRLDQLP